MQARPGTCWDLHVLRTIATKLVTDPIDQTTKLMRVSCLVTLEFSKNIRSHCSIAVLMAYLPEEHRSLSINEKG